MPRPPISSEDSSATVMATTMRRADMRTPRLPPPGAAHATYMRNCEPGCRRPRGSCSGRRGDVAGEEHPVDGLDPRGADQGRLLAQERGHVRDVAAATHQALERHPQ